jgi:hypothetical protein
METLAERSGFFEVLVRFVSVGFLQSPKTVPRDIRIQTANVFVASLSLEDLGRTLTHIS